MPAEKKRKEPLRVGNFILTVGVILTAVISLVMVNPRRPVPPATQAGYQTFIDRCNAIIEASRNSTVVTSAEFNSFFHAVVLKQLQSERDYLGHPDPITFRDAYFHNGKVVLVIHYRNRKYPLLEKDIFISGKVVVGNGRMVFKPKTMSCGLLYVPAVLVDKLLHPLEKRFLKNMRIPEAIKDVTVRSDEATLERRLQ